VDQLILGGQVGEVRRFGPVPVELLAGKPRDRTDGFLPLISQEFPAIHERVGREAGGDSVGGAAVVTEDPGLDIESVTPCEAVAPSRMSLLEPVEPSHGRLT
jgi:hypothetical protein